MEKKSIIVAMIAFALLSATAVIAADARGAQRGPIFVNDTGSTTGDNYTAIGGNITGFNIDVNIYSSRWVGLFGNVTYSVGLDGSTGASFYSWGTFNPASGTVLFANTSTVAWGSIAAGTVATEVTEDTTLGFGTDPDNVSQTFNEDNAASFTINGVAINKNDASSLNTSSNGGNSWETVLLISGSSIVYAGPIQQNNQNYLGNPVDFQVMVPVFDSSGQRDYYLFAEVPY